MQRIGMALAVGLALAGPPAGFGRSTAPSFVAVDLGLGALEATEVNWGDYDNDGDLDLVLQGFEGGSRFARLYRNDAGTFVHETNAVLLGLTEGPVVFGDYDRDGDLDLACAGWSGGGTGSRIYRNDGGGTFTMLNAYRGMKGADAAWGDLDNDGDLDLVLVGESYDPPQGDYAQIYRNDGLGVFTLAVDLPGVYLGEVALGDYDRDGDLDLALTGRTVGTRIYRNDGGLVFTDIQAGLPALMASSVSWADIDNDGDLDLAVCGSGDGGATATHFEIYRNDAGAFVALGTGLPAVHFGELDWADFDNDGDPDLLVVGLQAGGTPISRVYRNDGGGNFVDAGLGMTGLWNQASGAWGDYDDDGDLDVALAGQDAGGTLTYRIYRHDGTTANAPPSAPAEIRVFAEANGLRIGWDPGSDAETPVAGLTYNLRVGTSPGAQNVMAPMADLSTGRRRLPAPGNAGQNLSWTLRNLPPGVYYCSVQAVDGGFRASGWAPERVAVVSAGPRVTAMSPAPGAVLGVAPSSVGVTLSLSPDAETVNESSVVLTHEGADAILGTADDVLVPPVALTVAGTQITLDLSGLALPNGAYRLRVRGDEMDLPGNANRWRLDDLGGVTVHDSAGTLQGTLGGATMPAWSPWGRLGGALEFYGNDARVLLSGADLPRPWTASLWVARTDSPAADARLMDSPTSSLRLEQFNNTNRVGITVPTVVDFAYGYQAPVGTYVHLVFVGDPKGTSLYVNGLFSQQTGILMGCPRTTLGSVGFNSMHGALDEVRLFDRRLSEFEIRALAALGGAVREATGQRLDGEFAGTFPSGDGAPGADFVADFTLAVPVPVVTGMSPAPGSAPPAAPSTITLTTSIPLDPASVSPAAVRLARSGPDLAFDTPDDVAVVPASLTLLGGTTLEIGLPGGLPDDHYRVTLSGVPSSPPGAVNVWTLDDGSGTTALDSAGSAHGTLGGADGGRPSWAVGRRGRGLRFRGVEDRVQIGAGDVPPPWTAAMWVRREDATAEDARLMDSMAYSLRLEQFDRTNRTGVTVGGATDTAYLYTAPVGQWVHLAFVGEADGTSLYVDGVLSEKVPTVLGCPRASLGSTTRNSMAGVLDDVRIYGRALTAAEVRSLASLDGALRNPAGLILDGEFAGAFPSGDGTSGGDFVATFTVGTPAAPPPPPTSTTADLTAGGCGLLGAEWLLLLLLLKRRPRPAVLVVFALLSAAGLARAQEEPPEPVPIPGLAPLDDAKVGVGFGAAARAGFWFHPEFDAQTAAGRRRLRREAMGELGADAEYRFDSWFARVSFHYARGDDVAAWIGGVHVGQRLPLEPLLLDLSAGIIRGRLDVDPSEFGDFDPATGVQVRAELTWASSSVLELGVWLDYRHLKFEFDEQVLSGDREAFGSTAAVGAGVRLRF